ncbi:hypothetical protein P7K49_015266, partial [Saguinus oedipus]
MTYNPELESAQTVVSAQLSIESGSVTLTAHHCQQLCLFLGDTNVTDEPTEEQRSSGFTSSLSWEANSVSVHTINLHGLSK